MIEHSKDVSFPSKIPVDALGEIQLNVHINGIALKTRKCMKKLPPGDSVPKEFIVFFICVFIVCLVQDQLKIYLIS